MGAAPLAKAVHKATGLERGTPDGHLAAPIEFEPTLWRWARELTAAYRGVFRVTARLGVLRADWDNLPPGTTAGHYTARDRDGLVAKLDAALGTA